MNMGGKTQQRVAGNAKPANSGRIRELLINKQSVAASPGNIITFSALSNKTKLCPPSGSDKDDKSRPDKKILDAEPIQPEKQLTTDLKSSEEPSSSPVKEKYKLFVKRVGNRDLYTRVKFSEQVEHDDGSSKPAVSPSEAGVKKPTHSLDETSLLPIENKTENDEEVDDDINDGQLSDDKSESESEGEELDNDFDQLINRLVEIQAMSQANANIDNLEEVNEKLIENELEFVRLLKTLVRKYSQDLSIEEWDLIMRSIDKWINWIGNANHPLRETFQSNFSVRVFKFIDHLICFAENLKAQEDNLKEFPMMQSLLNDWANFHSSNIFQDLLVLYFKLISLEGGDNELTSDIIRPMIEALAHIIVGVDPKIVLSHYSLLDHLSSKIEFDTLFKVPKNSIFCNVDERKFKNFLAVFGLLRSNFRVTLVSAHAMLSNSMNPICENAMQAVILASCENQEEVIDEDLPIFPPAALVSILTSRDSIMTALLSDYRVGDTSVTIEHNTDAYTCTLSYLFVWDLVIQFIVGVDKETGHKIIHTLKKLGFIQRLLDNIFKLLPPLGEQNSLRFRIYKSAPTSKYSARISNQSFKEQESWNLESFLKSPLRTTIKRPLNEIELIALHVYFSVSLHMPVTVRNWYNNNSNNRLCNLVNEYTVKHVSQVICSLEMESVHEKCLDRATQVELSNLTVKARPSAKEVYAIYKRDEFKMELTIKLPLNYPLGSVQIDGGKRVGVTDGKWRNWLLQLTTFLAHQNGPILDGIDLWRKNIDKRFEGVEKCTICFSILHSNYQLPKKKCQTCLNMYHNLCLFKWFESSGNSTCPLCRNPW